jgi:hypothetical protein
LLKFLKPATIFRPAAKVPFSFDTSWESEILPRRLFKKMLCLERMRAERSERRFVLMILEPGGLLSRDDQNECFEKILFALSQSTRETDITGWCGNGTTIGVLFTEIGASDASIVSLLSSRVNSALHNALSGEQLTQIALSFQVFPDDCASPDPSC